MSLFLEMSADDFGREQFAAQMSDLADRGCLIGTSSWKYAGWLGQVYSQERYLTRNRFSLKKFEAECITEYAETFRTVCGDFAFYQFPTEQFWSGLFGRIRDPRFRWSFKVPEHITVCKYPSLPRYGARAGQPNPTFLDAELLESGFLGPLRQHKDHIGVLIFEFGALAEATLERVDDFLACLDAFFRVLSDEFRYAVEIRNPELLIPEYFNCLRTHRVAHVYNAWTRMPTLPSQLALPGSLTADFVVCRALLKQGRYYADAVKRFEPYERVQEADQASREGLQSILRLAADRPAFVYVNNRLEGNAPGTIRAITEAMK